MTATLLVITGSRTVLEFLPFMGGGGLDDVCLVDSPGAARRLLAVLDGLVVVAWGADVVEWAEENCWLQTSLQVVLMLPGRPPPTVGVRALGLSNAPMVLLPGGLGWLNRLLGVEETAAEFHD